MQISPHRVNVIPAAELLDYCNILAGAQEPRSKRMAEVVKSGSGDAAIGAQGLNAAAPGMS